MTKKELLQIIEQAKENKSAELDLSFKKLTELPKEIAQLTNLKSLYLNHNQLSKLPKEITQLTNLQSLYLGYNQLTEFPKEITQLKKLQWLDLSNNHVRELPKEIAQLTNLQSLYLDHNQLTELPKEIAQLIYLLSLNLRGNQICALSKEVTQLKNLQELALNNNLLSELPKEIAQLSYLLSLSLGGNQLKELPKEINQLKNLQLLSFGGNQFSELPREVTQLKNLQSLYLGSNLLSELPKEIINLTNLQRLDLSKNQFSELPKEIVQLNNLQRLDLSKNQFSEFPKEITQLENLQELYLSENQLKAFAEDLINLKSFTLLILGDDHSLNSIGSEALSRMKTPKELLDYYSLLKGETKELNEAKIMVVGQGSVGKTSLIKRLINGAYNPDENKTNGIDIYKEWKENINDRKVQLNVWDFGGQEIMHATHQFFLTQRCVYVLVLDARINNDDKHIEYWLEKIKILGGDSPVMVVGNKIDQHPFDINQTELNRKYPNIVGFYSVSCKTQKNLGKLKTDLIETTGTLSGIHEALPASWFAVKEELENMKDDYISYEKYAELCLKHKVVEIDHQKRLIGLLHDLGVALNFSEDVRMQDTNVLNPEWVTQGVYRIINSIDLFKAKGVLRKRMLNDILDTRQYPSNKQIFIIDMMKKFELCFDITPDKTFLVPDLLPAEELNTGNWRDSLKFEYHYPIYFNSIITRFIVKMHEKISKTTCWRTGVVLEYKSGDEILNEALIKADSAEKKIFIFIRGNEQTRREFLYGIREKFEDIHYTFSKEFAEKDVAEKLPIPTNPKYLVDYKHLLKMEAEGKGDEYIYPEGLTEKFKVKDLLRGVRSDKELEEKGNQAKDFKGDVKASVNSQHSNDEPFSNEELISYNDGIRCDELSSNIARLIEISAGVAIIWVSYTKSGELIKEWKEGNAEAISFIYTVPYILGVTVICLGIFRNQLSLEWVDRKLVEGIRWLIFKLKGKDLKQFNKLIQKLAAKQKK